jgi:hypothetical protein
MFIFLLPFESAASLFIVDPEFSSTETAKILQTFLTSIGVRRGVSKRVADSRKPPDRATPETAVTISGVVRLQGEEGLGMAGRGESLGSPWPPFAIRPGF